MMRAGSLTRASRRLIVVAAAFAVAVASLAAGGRPAAALEPPEGLIPAPTRLPVGHPQQAGGEEIGYLRIPAIGLDVTLRSGVAMSVLAKGPGHWAGTSRPGGPGNVVVAGHRTTKTRPFYYLNRLEAGDTIVMSDGPSPPAVYLVTETLIVDPDDIWITYETGEPIVTLFACHPRGSARHRIVVRGSLLAGLPVSLHPTSAPARAMSLLAVAR